MPNVPDLLQLVPENLHPWLQLAALAVSLIALFFVWRWTRRRPIEDVLTIVAASIATGVSAQGMWRFTGDVLGLDGPLRLLLFAFIEVAIVTSAVRARRNMRENFSAGVDGIAVWALTVLTAVLSSMDSASFPEAVFRLAAPLVAAWLWERGMAIERHRIRGTGRINWRITPERILVRLGLAEAKDRTASEVDVHRRLTRVSLAILRVDDHRDATARKQRRAMAGFRTAIAQAVEHAGLASDPAAQQIVLDQIDTLRSADALAQRKAIAKWANPVDQAAHAKAAAALDELARLNAREATQRALDKAALTLMAATESSTPLSTAPVVNGWVGESVDERVRDERPWRSSSTLPSTPVLTSEQVDNEVDFDVADPSVYDLEQLWLSSPSSTVPSTGSSTPSEVDEQVDDDAGKASKTEVMRAFWESEVAQKRYPRPIDLANHAGASRSLAARLLNEWVEELSGWEKRNARKALRSKASA